MQFRLSKQLLSLRTEWDEDRTSRTRSCHACDGPLPPSLRQEFRELKLLDDITRLKYERTLPKAVTGSTRNDIISQFLQWKGQHYVPEQTDASLKWSANDNLHPPAQRTVKGHFVPAKGSKPVRRGPPGSPSDDHPSKKQKISSPPPLLVPVFDQDGPIGLEWDGEDWSCAYDTLFGILYNIWTENPRTWNRRLRSIGNNFLTALTKGFGHFEAGKMSLEDVRDGIRSLLHAHSPHEFPLGQIGASVGVLASAMLKQQDAVTYTQHSCTN